VERGFDRGVGKLRDLGRLRQRLVHPTGMSVLVIGSESGSAQRSQTACGKAWPRISLDGQGNASEHVSVGPVSGRKNLPRAEGRR